MVSPDGKTLLILTSGYNRIFYPVNTVYGGYINSDHTAYDYANSEEYVFIYDISQGAPVQKQVVTIPNSYNGITFDPSGTAFYVSGGVGDYPFVGGLPRPSTPATPKARYTLCRKWRQCARICFRVRPKMGRATGTVDEPLYGPWAERGKHRTRHGKWHHFRVGLRSRSGHFQRWPDPGCCQLRQRLDLGVHWRFGNRTSVPSDIDLRPGDGTTTTMGTPGGEYPFWVRFRAREKIRRRTCRAFATARSMW